MRWDQYYNDVPQFSGLKKRWNKCLSITCNAFSPPPFQQCVWEWLWTYQKINPVLAHTLSAAGTHNDPFYTRASSNMYRRNPPSDSDAVCYAPGSFQQKCTCAVFIDMLLHHLHHEWETTFLWKYIINKIQQTLWNGRSMLWEYLEIFFLLVYHQLMDSDPGHHCLGEQEHSSKAH